MLIKKDPTILKQRKFKRLKSLYRNKERVRRFWQKTGAHSLSDQEFQELTKKLLYDNSWQTIINALMEVGKISKEDKILEVGCGWGRILVGLRKYLPSSYLVGTDITRELLTRAQQVLKKEAGSLRNIELMTADIDALPFKDNSFNKTLAIRVLQYLPDPQKSLAELKRVTKKNGRVVIAVPNKFNLFYFLKYHTKLYSPAEVKKWFSQKGFSEIQIKTIRFLPLAHHFSFDSKIMILEKMAQKIPLIRRIGAVIIIAGEKV